MTKKTFQILIIILFLIKYCYGADDSSVMVFVTDEQGKWLREAQQRLLPERNRIRSNNINFEIISSPDQIINLIDKKNGGQLLFFPAFLTGVQDAGSLVNADFMIIIKRENMGVQPGACITAYSFADGTAVHTGPILAAEPGEAITKAYSQVSFLLEQKTLEKDMEVQVSGESTFFHKTGVNHLPPGQVTSLKFKQARQDEFLPCPVCFPYYAESKNPSVIEVALSTELSKKIETEFLIEQNSSDLQRINNLYEKIAEKNNFEDDFEFFVLKNSNPNAFSVPGGKIYITTGLIQMLETDSELAGVLAHEMGHVINKHSLKLFYNNSNYSLVDTLLDFAGTGPLAAPLADYAGSYLKNSWNRQFETEADVFAIAVLSNSDYQPGHYISLLQKLNDYESSQPGVVWSNTHPNDQKRIEEAREVVVKQKQLQNQLNQLQADDQKLAAYIRKNLGSLTAYYTELPEIINAYEGFTSKAEVKPAQNQGFELVPLGEKEKEDSQPGNLKPPDKID
ncbi:MAG: M48 family metallopeptidase [Vulcanimicrobiota bacterium]